MASPWVGTRARLVGACAVLVIGVGVAPAAEGHFPDPGKRCRAVFFDPGSDSGAVAIRANHLRCRRARRVAVAFGRDKDKTPFGFSCVTGRRQHGDAQRHRSHTDVRCVRGVHRVVFALT